VIEANKKNQIRLIVLLFTVSVISIFFSTFSVLKGGFVNYTINIFIFIFLLIIVAKLSSLTKTIKNGTYHSFKKTLFSLNYTRINLILILYSFVFYFYNK